MVRGGQVLRQKAWKVGTEVTTYTVSHAETLPSIADKLGHPGEWQALAAANLALVPDTDPPLSDEAKAHLVAEKVRDGTELTIPTEWIARAERELPEGKASTPEPEPKPKAEREPEPRKYEPPSHRR